MFFGELLTLIGTCQSVVEHWPPVVDTTCTCHAMPKLITENSLIRECHYRHIGDKWLERVDQTDWPKCSLFWRAILPCSMLRADGAIWHFLKSLSTHLLLSCCFLLFCFVANFDFKLNIHKLKMVFSFRRTQSLPILFCARHSLNINDLSNVFDAMFFFVLFCLFNFVCVCVVFFFSRRT